MKILDTIKSLFSATTNEAERSYESLSGSERSQLLGEVTEHLNQYLKENNIQEAFTQADIELALDDRGWLVGGKRMAGELDPLSRQVQINRSRYYWLRDPLVKQAVRLWTDYAFGADAISWKADDDGIQSKLDKFMKDRRNRRYTSRAGMRRLSQRLLIDGELFFAIYDDGTMRAIDCLQITDILTDTDDEDKVVAYKRVTTGAFGQAKKTLYYKPWDLPEGEEANMGQGEYQPYYQSQNQEKIVYEDGVVMYHLAFDAFEKRGTTLISATSDWSREHRRFMTARVALTQALSRFAFKTTVKGGQKAVDSMRSKLESTFAQTGLSGGTEHQPANAPGGNFLSNEGVTLEAMPRSSGANEAKADADNLKLQVCAGTGIMLHYFGDPSIGNLATATAMELPMLKMFGAYQVLWKDAWRDLFAIVLQENPDDEPTKITTTMPEILESDLQALGSFITPFFAAFPEAKTPRVMRECLESLSIEDIEDVMNEIEQNKEKMDTNVAAGKNPDGSEKTELQVVNAKNGTIKSKDQAGGPAGTNPDQTESARLIAKLEKLIEVMQ